MKVSKESKSLHRLLLLFFSEKKIDILHIFPKLLHFKKA